MQATTPQEERPPLLGSWNNLYKLTIGFFIFQVIVYYLLTRWLA